MLTFLPVRTGLGAGLVFSLIFLDYKKCSVLEPTSILLEKFYKSNFFKAPTKKQIEYLKKYSQAPLIQENLAKNVQIILDSKAIMNDLSGKNKGGGKLPEFNKVKKVFKNAG